MYTVTKSSLFARLAAACEAGDNNAAAVVGRVLNDTLEKLSRLTGELRQLTGLTINNNTQINVGTAPEFLVLQDGLLAIARTIPEAKGPIVELIRRIVAGAQNPSASSALTIEGDAVDQMELAHAG